MLSENNFKVLALQQGKNTLWILLKEIGLLPVANFVKTLIWQWC